MRKIKKIIIHCADTPNGKNFDVKDIDQWHRARGFNKSGAYSMSCGYHYVIKVNGVIEKGRGLQEVGAHCKGQNHSSVGVCLIGKDSFDDVQWVALRQLIEELKSVFGKLEVCGHREFASYKTCPNFDVKKELESGRLKALK